MLGNWYFGDYFKLQAISSARELLTKSLHCLFPLFLERQSSIRFLCIIQAASLPNPKNCRFLHSKWICKNYLALLRADYIYCLLSWLWGHMPLDVELTAASSSDASAVNTAVVVCYCLTSYVVLQLVKAILQAAECHILCLES